MMAEADRDYDAFFLSHLQSVQGTGAWYKNQRFVGKGGNGTTFFVTCTSGINQGFHFALKVFHRISDARRRERFLDEVRHYKNLSHPSILRVFDEGTFRSGDRVYPFAVIDYMPETLASKLGRGAPQIPRLLALRFMMNVASGVNYLHTLPQPVIHRDIKPSNILINEPMARLGDLGLAMVARQDPITREEVAEFSPYVAMPFFYRTPELVQMARGQATRLTPASDIYQLGLVTYQCMTGFNPQRRPHGDNFLSDIELDVRDIDGSGGPRLSELIRHMLNPTPANRPAAAVVLMRLNQVHDEVCGDDLRATGVMR